MARLKGSVRKKARQQQNQLLKSRFEASETPTKEYQRERQSSGEAAEEEAAQQKHPLEIRPGCIVRHPLRPPPALEIRPGFLAVHPPTPARAPEIRPGFLVVHRRHCKLWNLSPPTGATASFGDPSGLLRSPSTGAILAPSIQALRTVSAWDYMSEYNLPGVSPDHIQVRDGRRLVSIISLVDRDL
ncbi:hypothetical protein Q7P36_005159 [Cladosporium allicinum]